MAEILNTNNAISDGMLVRQYGAGMCPLCGQQHDGNTTIIESGGSRAVVEILLAHLMNDYDGLTGGAQRKVKFMIGALVPSGGGRSAPILIAASGAAPRAEFIRAASSMPNTVVCGQTPTPVTTRGGRVLTQQEIAGWKVDNEPLLCAAPKLIMEARRRGYGQPWDMSEIWVNPHQGAREWKKKKKEGYTKHGWSIESCKTCANVVPALLCNLA